MPDRLPPGKQSGVEPGPLWASVGEPDLGSQAFSVVLTFWNQASRGHLWLAVRSSALSLTWELKAAGSPGTGTPLLPKQRCQSLHGTPRGGGRAAGRFGLQISNSDEIRLPWGDLSWNVCSQGPPGARWLLALMTSETMPADGCQRISSCTFLAPP